MWKKLALLLALLLAGVVGLALTKPDTFHVERAAHIAAPPDKIFPLINDFHQWGSWSPWEKLDPAMQRVFTGPENGPGSAYSWQGNSEVGKGRMEILRSTPGSQVVIQLDFIEPFEGHNTTEFTLTPDGDGTRVQWAMQGPSTFVTKVMQVFMSMDAMIGADFEKGLANLKAAAEKPAAR